MTDAPKLNLHILMIKFTFFISSFNLSKQMVKFVYILSMNANRLPRGWIQCHCKFNTLDCHPMQAHQIVISSIVKMSNPLTMHFSKNPVKW